MPDALTRPAPAPLAPLHGAAVLHRVRRLLIWALVTGIAYSVLGGAGAAYCPGRSATRCVSAQLEPSAGVFVGLAVVVIVTLGRVLRTAADESEAIRRIDRTVVWIVGFVIVWTVITHVSFATIDLSTWDGTEPFFFDGVRFGTITIEEYPDRMEP